MKRVLTILCSLSAFALGGCAGAGVDGTPPQLDKSLTKGGKADEWGPSDDPSLFSNNLEYRLEALPMEGEAENIPWTGSYWPVYEDSINKKWNGSSSKSPAAKFGEAFGITDLENKVSQHHGIDHFRSSRKECESSSDCDGDTQAAKGSCAKREGAG